MTVCPRSENPEDVHELRQALSEERQRNMRMAQELERLQARVQECKACNLRNCQLIMEQAEVMRGVIAGSSQPDIYVPF